MKYYFIDRDIFYQGKRQSPRKVQLFQVRINDKIATGYDKDGNLYHIKRQELIKENDYPELTGKCKEYIEKELCLGCERLSYPEFTHDDNCSVIKERKEYEKKKGMED